MSKCKSCQAPIVWCITPAGRRLPVDAESRGDTQVPRTFDDGNVVPTGRRVLNSREVRVLHKDELAETDRLDERYPERFRTHFASCPNASTHRKSGDTA